jgi:acetolactate synthase-1/2/3 large subunit
VLIDICKDVTAAVAEYEFKPAANPRETPIGVTDNQIAGVAEVINKSRRPIILSGGGVSISHADEEVRTLAEKARIPVATTLMGLGSFPGSHELFTGLVGMHGTRTSNMAVKEADLFIAIGARFSDRVISNVKEFAPNAEIVHIDIDPAEIGKNVTANYPLTGNIKKILKLLNTRVTKRTNSEWNRRIAEWKEKHPLKYARNGDLKPHYVVERIYELTKGEALIATEVGQNQIWAAQFYKYSYPRQFVSSGGLGTMGYGLGASIGAKIGKPDKKVINIAGDGSFRMNCTELATAVEYKLPIVIALFNNRVLGMVRQWQDLFYDKRYSATTIDRGTDFVKLAEAFGAIGIKVTSNEEVDGAIKVGLESTDKPVLIDFRIGMDEKVFPIVPPGAPIDELIEE